MMKKYCKIILKALVLALTPIWGFYLWYFMNGFLTATIFRTHYLAGFYTMAMTIGIIALVWWLLLRKKKTIRARRRDASS